MSKLATKVTNESSTTVELIPAYSGSVPYVYDPFDSYTRFKLAIQKRVVTCEITSFEIDSSVLKSVSADDIRLETLSDVNLDVLTSLGHLSPALAALKKK